MTSNIKPAFKQYVLLFAQICFVFILAGILFQSCKKDNNDDDKTSLPDGVWTSDGSQFPISVTGNVTYVLNNDGILWGRGSAFSASPKADEKGYLKLEENILKFAIGNYSERLYVIRKDNTVWRGEMMDGDWEAPFIEQNKAHEKVTDNAQSVCVGRDFAVILKRDGTAWAIGANKDGQFGIGTGNTQEILPLTKIASDVRQIAAGSSAIYLLKNNNTLWSAGNYLYGSLGYDTGDQKQTTFRKVMDDVQLVRAQGTNVMLIKIDGTAWSFGSNANGVQGNGVQNFDPVYPHQVADETQEVFPLGTTSYFLKKDGTLWASGSNHYGQMGKETPKINLKFIPIAEQVSYMSSQGISSHHIVILQDGVYKMAGDNEGRQLSQIDQGTFHEFQDFVMP